jgi:hypothetical protein
MNIFIIVICVGYVKCESSALHGPIVGAGYETNYGFVIVNKSFIASLTTPLYIVIL